MWLAAWRWLLVGSIGAVGCTMLWGAFGPSSAIAFGVPYGLIMGALLVA